MSSLKSLCSSDEAAVEVPIISPDDESTALTPNPVTVKTASAAATVIPMITLTLFLSCEFFMIKKHIKGTVTKRLTHAAFESDP